MCQFELVTDSSVPLRCTMSQISQLFPGTFPGHCFPTPTHATNSSYSKNIMPGVLVELTQYPFPSALFSWLYSGSKLILPSNLPYPNNLVLCTLLQNHSTCILVGISDYSAYSSFLTVRFYCCVQNNYIKCHCFCLITLKEPDA